MKKFILILFFLGAVFFLLPEYMIIADITTKMLCSVLWYIATLCILGVLFYKFQRYCDDTVRKMWKNKKQELAGKNVEIIYPTFKDIVHSLAYALPRVLLAVFIGVILYLAIALSWNFIHSILKYIGYVFGALLVILGIICAIPIKNEHT